MLRVRSLAENPLPRKATASGFASEVTTRSGLALTALALVGLGLGFCGLLAACLARRVRSGRLVRRLLLRLGLRLGDRRLSRGLRCRPRLLGLGCCRSFFLSRDLI